MVNIAIEDISLICDSGLFDVAWYREQYAVQGEMDALVIAYLTDWLDREPGPDFSGRHYLVLNPDVAEAGMNPLLHYLRHGRSEGRQVLAVGAPLPSLEGARSEQHLSEYETISRSCLFDDVHYLACQSDVREHGLDPLLHFIQHGLAEGRQPNPFFDTIYYRQRYMDAGDERNPLVHYLTEEACCDAATSQRFDGAWYRATYGDVNGCTPLEHFLTVGLPLGRRAVPSRTGSPRLAAVADLRKIHCTVIVPIHNAADAVRECLDSLLRNTRFGVEDHLLLIDDGSSQAGISELLDLAARKPGVRVVCHETCQGYTATVNHGMREAAGDDVVLLNSDTVVGPHWLRRLKATAASSPQVGTVTAVSNAAGEFSVPRSGAHPAPAAIHPDVAARAVENAAGDCFEVPTGNGFCLYIKRSMLDAVGGFDEQAFPEGYGEENDLCQRAAAAGWTHLVDPSVYVRHRRSASFGGRRKALIAAGVSKVCERFPMYEGAIAAISTSPVFEDARYRIDRQFRSLVAGGRPPRQRVLYVLSTRVGGTPQTNADLMAALGEEYDAFALASDGTMLEVLRVTQGGVYEALERFELNEPLRFATHRSAEYDRVVRALMLRWGIDLLHVRHLAWHGLGLIEAAQGLGIPVVVSFHDFYSICPTVNLLDFNGDIHPGGVAGDGPNPLWHHDPTRVPMNAERLSTWQRNMQAALEGAAAFITTAEFARSLLMDALPLLRDRARHFHVIPHGRDFERLLVGPDATSLDGRPLRVLLPGNLSPHKGSMLIRELLAGEPLGSYEFHVLGSCPPELQGLVVEHGSYLRKDFGQLVEVIKPDVAAVLSIWPETYCHTLTECWAAGLPVIGVDVGAVGERIAASEAGWLLPFPVDKAALKSLLQRLVEEPAERERGQQKVRRWQEQIARNATTAKMAAAYRAIYGGLL
ncbi:putative glycosyltransferase EpsJ [compost metagenome]